MDARNIFIPFPLQKPEIPSSLKIVFIINKIDDLKSIDACLNTVNLSKGAVIVFAVIPPIVPNNNFSLKNINDDAAIVAPVMIHKILNCFGG